MSKLISIVTALLLSFNLSQTALADSQCGKQYGYKGKIFKLYKKLDLTDEQKQKVKAIKQQYKEGKKALYSKYKGLRGKMHELIKPESIDQDKLNALIQKKQEMLAEKIKLKVKMKRAIYQVITPEQRKKLEQVVKKMRQKCNKD
jgi:periplasmic protein CpxP/Spy